MLHERADAHVGAQLVQSQRPEAARLVLKVMPQADEVGVGVPLEAWQEAGTQACLDRGQSHGVVILSERDPGARGVLGQPLVEPARAVTHVVVDPRVRPEVLARASASHEIAVGVDSEVDVTKLSTDQRLRGGCC